MRCSACGHHVGQWVGRCPGCGAWGTVEEVALAPARPGGAGSSGVAPIPLVGLGAAPEADQRVSTGFDGMDRGPGRRAGAGVGVAPRGRARDRQVHLAAAAGRQPLGRGPPCLLVSGEESHAQVAARARRLGIAGDAVGFAPGRDLAQVLDTADAAQPFLLAVDSIQTLRDTSGTQMPGGVSQVRICTDALVGLAKSERHRRRADGPRHQGRRPRGAAQPRARRRRRPDLRRRPPFGAAGAVGRQEPVRAGRRNRLVRDGSRRACAPSTPPACWCRGAHPRRRHRAAAGGPPGPRGRGPGAGRLARGTGTTPGDGPGPAPVPTGGGRPRPGRRAASGALRAVRGGLGGRAGRRSRLRPGRGGRAGLRRYRGAAARRARRSSARLRSRASCGAAPAMAQRLAAARAAGCTTVYAAETSSAPSIERAGRGRRDAISATPSAGCVRRPRRARARLPDLALGPRAIGPCFPSHRPLTCGFGLRRKAGPC